MAGRPGLHQSASELRDGGIFELALKILVSIGIGQLSLDPDPKRCLRMLRFEYRLFLLGDIRDGLDSETGRRGRRSYRLLLEMVQPLFAPMNAYIDLL